MRNMSECTDLRGKFYLAPRPPKKAMDRLAVPVFAALCLHRQNQNQGGQEVKSMPGRPRTPTNVKMLRGTFRKDRVNAAEPQPEAAIPTCPSFLSKEAKREWRRLSSELYILGLLTRIDRVALAAYCQAYGRWVEAEQHLTKEGLTTKAQSGYEQPSPWLPIANKALEQVRAVGAEFGIGPASRSKVSLTATPPTTSNKLSKYIGEDEREQRFFGSK
jgi:P27 family predicted phage terminase small subunit